MPQHFEEKISSELIYTGKIFTVTKDIIQLENGKTSFREVVHHNGGSGIIAINKNDEVALVRQYRYAAEKEMLEIPAGKVEAGEPPKETALREIKEEIGFSTNFAEDFGTVAPTCAYCTEVIYIYLADKLYKVEQNLDEDEFLTVEWIPFEKVVDLILDGTITDSKTVSGILRLKILRDRGIK